MLLDQQTGDAGSAGQVRIAQEASFTLGEQLLVGRDNSAFFGAFPTATRLFFLATHGLIEAFAINGDAQFARHFFLLVSGQAEGVV